jgi:WD repeat-containing protein 76
LLRAKSRLIATDHTFNYRVRLFGRYQSSEPRTNLTRHTMPKRDADGLTAWERKRNENAANNAAALKAAGTASVKIFGNVQPNVQKKAPVSRKRARTEPVKREAPPATRRSARVAGFEADEETVKPRGGLVAETKAEDKKIRLSGDLDLTSIKVEEKRWTSGGLAAMVRGAQPGLRTFTEEDVEETSDEDLKKLRKLMSGLELYDKFLVKGKIHHRPQRPVY